MPATQQTRQRATIAVKNEPQIEHEDDDDDDVVIIEEEEEDVEPSLPPSEMEIQRKKLRQRWELASVLNFLNVFQPVIKSDLKISAEEIESALIEPNDSLAQLHISLLKGIVPSSKILNVSDGWVSVLSKKLSPWWPWVAEGNFPMTAGKGEEMNRYKKLDPTIRLFILKALCEIRVDQDDAVSYINDTMKSGTELSTIQKEKLGGDGKGTLYWYDGNAVIGHRLYKEVRVFDLKPKIKVKGNKLEITSDWETLATNFEEFHKVVNELSSSKVKSEVAVGKALEADILPALEKFQKKKERELKQQQRKERLLNGLRTSGISRSSRRQKPVNYRFEEFDKAIKEAIHVTQNKPAGGKKDKVLSNDDSNHDFPNESDGTESDSTGRDSTGSDTDNEKHQCIYEHQNANDDCEEADDSDKELILKEEEENDEVDQKNNSNPVFKNLDGWSVHKPNASVGCKRPGGHTNLNISEDTSLTRKHRLRQRPTVNTAVESRIVPDSDDEMLTKDMVKRARFSGNSTQVAAPQN